MKRILFYLLLAVQLIVLLFLTFQFEKIDEQGKMIKIHTIKPEYPMYDFVFEDSMYVEYEINKIPQEKWNNSSTVDYNNRVYVLLKRDNNGIFQVEQASIDRLTTDKEEEVVVVGTYHYHDEALGYHYVSYGMEKIKNVEQFGEFRGNDQLLVTMLIGKWGQYKNIAIEKVME